VEIGQTYGPKRPDNKKELILKKVMIALVAAVSLSAFAGDYAAVDYSVKKKTSSTQHNDVYGLNVGHKVDSLTTEVRFENETTNTSKQEGLMQLKGIYDLGSVVGVAPYAAAAVGHKMKATENFEFYVAELGAKTNVGPVGFKLASRLRSPFDEKHIGSGSKYRTYENSLTAGYKISNNDTISVKYAVERGDSNYKTTGLAFNHAF
jgi:hypothetical protein